MKKHARQIFWNAMLLTAATLLMRTVGVSFQVYVSNRAGAEAMGLFSLMSGVCDLMVIVKGKTLHEVSSFVAKELATIDSVTSTATQFIMRRYKEFGVELMENDEDEREKIFL